MLDVSRQLLSEFLGVAFQQTKRPDVYKVSIGLNAVLFHPVKHLFSKTSDIDAFYDAAITRPSAHVDDPYSVDLISSIEYYATSACQFACKYCYLGALPDKLSKQDKTPDDALSTIKRLAHENRLADSVTIQFIGGEPLLAFNALHWLTDELLVLTEATGIKFNYSITTSGQPISERVVEWFVRHRIGLNISYDGTQNNSNRPHKHNADAGIKKTVSLLRGMKFSIRATLLPSQALTQSDILLEAKELGAFDAYIDIARAQKFTKNQLEHIVVGLKRLETVGDKMGYVEGHISNARRVLKSRSLSLSHCSAGKSHIVLNSSGQLRPCANIATEAEFKKFGSIAYSADNDSYCGSCAIRYLCNGSGGGCRAWRIKNDSYAPDTVDCLIFSARMALALARKLDEQL